MNREIGVVLVNYNGKEYNNKCISSIFNSSCKEKLQVVVVDNASTDDSLVQLQRDWSENEQVHLISLDDNYGFSRANNEGIRWLHGQGIQYYLILNNDTEIEVDTIERMFDCHKKTGNIVVPKIFYADNPDIIWCAGGTFSKRIKKPIQRGINSVDQGQYNKREYCDFANGCCMLLSKRHLEQVGFLNEDFFLYYEDTEYSLRAREKGERIMYCPEAKVYHKVNGSTKGNESAANAYYITRNWLICNGIHMDRKHFRLFQIYFLFNRFAWILIWGIQGKTGMIKGIYDGIRDFRAGVMGKYRRLTI